jgi:putative membrane protein
MARTIRAVYAGAGYHVEARGSERKAIYRNHADRLQPKAHSVEEAADARRLIKSIHLNPVRAKGKHEPSWPHSPHEGADVLMPYSRFRREEMILRDLLARERTVLANERTLLAYVRTAIGLMAAGGTVLTVFPENLAMRTLGISLLIMGVGVGVFGSWRFSVVAGHMRRLGTGPGVPRTGVEETGGIQAEDGAGKGEELA